MVQPRLLMSCDQKAVALIDKDTAWDLISRALSHPSGPPPGKPKRSLLYAYIGGGVARQSEAITGLVIRTRHIGLTAAVITAAKLLSWRWPGQEHVDFYEDTVMFGEGQDVQPPEQALHVLEPHFQNLRQGDVVARLYNLLSPKQSTTELQRPAPESEAAVVKFQSEADLHISAGPEDEFEPDRGQIPGTLVAFRTLLSPPLSLPDAAPVVTVARRLPRGARLGIDIGGGVLMHIGDVRHPEQCGFRPGAEDWVAMMITELGATNTHIISRVSGSGARLKNFLGSSGFFVRTGFLPENIHFCRHRSGVQGKGMVFSPSTSPRFVDDRIDCLTDIATQTQKSAVLFLIPTTYASGLVDDTNLGHVQSTLTAHGIEIIQNLFEVGCH